MARDNAPVRYTCPMIDEIISAIDSVEWDEEYWTKKELIETMENIRHANDLLRSWGNDLYEKLQKLENQLDDEFNDLIRENESLKSEVSKLENKLLAVSI